MKKLLLTLAILGTTQMAMAYQSAEGKIKYIANYGKSVVFKLDKSFSNDDGCKDKASGTYFAIGNVNTDNQAQYSNLLAAAMAGKKIRIHYSGCIDSWSGLPNAYLIVTDF